jgi:hypothetical protein
MKIEHNRLYGSISDPGGSVVLPEPGVSAHSCHNITYRTAARSAGPEDGRVPISFCPSLWI